MARKYNLVFLEKITAEKNMILLKDYTNEDLHSQKFIEFKCIICNNDTSKRFEYIIKYDALCKDCSIYKVKNIIKYNLEFLDYLVNEKNMILLKDYTNEDLDSQKFLEFKCIDCKNDTSKKFSYIIKYDALCKVCSSKNSKIKCKNTILEKYGVENVSQVEEIKDKKKETTFKNYGVEHNSQSKKIKDKKIQTCFKNHGVEHPKQSVEVKEKGKQTCLKNYGVEYPIQSVIVKEKVNETNLQKYGVIYPSQTKKFRDRVKKTCLEKYGVEHPMQNNEIIEKNIRNSYRIKIFILPSGKELTCQGYEPYALEELVKENIQENDLITGCKNVPTIWYEDQTGKKHRHFVDIYIPSQNRCIEIKSTWTVKKDVHTIFLKQKAAKELGYNYEIWVYDCKGKKVETHT
jgi:ribosomal protein S27E